MAGKLLPLLPPLLLAAAGLAGLLLLTVPARLVREPPAFKFGIVLDAGSSHTSLFVYKWPADKENDTGVVSQHNACHVEGPGISNYSSRPAEAGRSLQGCLNSAREMVPRDRHADTPLFLGATAGMRLLSLQDPDAAGRVLREVSRTLAGYPFDFRGARVLSGEEEGLFGWVTVNYLLRNFIKWDWGGLWAPPSTATQGAMDLGGASTQITFETASPAEDPGTEVHLQLYGRRFRVYTHSFLCFGRDQVLLRLLAGAYKVHGPQHPCWPKGYAEDVELRRVFGSHCTQAQRPPGLRDDARVHLAGLGSPELCRQLVAGLFNRSACGFSRCSFDGVFQPPLAGGFIAFSAFFHTVNFLTATMGLPVTSARQLEDAVEALCQRPWRELQAQAPGVREDRLRDQCAGAAFVQQLLGLGYGFNESTFRRVTFQKEIDGSAVGWALGYMLNLTNMIPAEPPGLRKALGCGSWVALLLLFVALVLAAIVLLLCQARSAKSPSVI